MKSYKIFTLALEMQEIQEFNSERTIQSGSKASQKVRRNPKPKN
jgi:hypothetical protein